MNRDGITFQRINVERLNELTSPSPFANLIRRMGLGRAPHPPADTEGDEQGHTNEDGGAEPQGNLHLMNVFL